MLTFLTPFSLKAVLLEDLPNELYPGVFRNLQSAEVVKIRLCHKLDAAVLAYFSEDVPENPRYVEVRASQVRDQPNGLVEALSALKVILDQEIPLQDLHQALNYCSRLQGLLALDISELNLGFSYKMPPQSFTGLHTLNISYNSLNGHKLGNILGPLASLTSLDISHNPLRDEGILKLDVFKNLRVLRLKATHIGPKSIETIVLQFPLLRDLDLRGNLLSRASHLAPLKKLTPLERVFLQENPVEEAELAEIKADFQARQIESDLF